MIALLTKFFRRSHGFPHPHSLPGEEAVAWYNGYFTKDRTDLPYPPRLRIVR